jgi:serine/threonine protein kinase
MMKRFIHELRYSRKITHQNVIRIYDFIALGGLYAISMEYFASHPLSDELKDEKPLPLKRALQYSMDIATGMQVAHQAGIIHRDLKPANVLIDDNSLVKIVDFGVAAARASGDTQLTRTGYVIGSPKYMAPEQILGKKVDEKADVYSLGVMLYEMLTGFAPYTRGDHMSVMYQHVQGKAKRARDLNPNVSPGTVRFRRPVHVGRQEQAIHLDGRSAPRADALRRPGGLVPGKNRRLPAARHGARLLRHPPGRRRAAHAAPAWRAASHQVPRPLAGGNWKATSTRS